MESRSGQTKSIYIYKGAFRHDRHQFNLIHSPGYIQTLESNWIEPPQLQRRFQRIRIFWQRIQRWVPIPRQWYDSEHEHHGHGYYYEYELHGNNVAAHVKQLASTPNHNHLKQTFSGRSNRLLKFCPTLELHTQPGRFNKSARRVWAKLTVRPWPTT